MVVEQRGPAVGNDSNKKEGKGDMTKTPISLQDLRRSLYVKAKAEATWRFWGSIRSRLQDGNTPRSLPDGEK
jgi:hypothetical protein